MKVGQSSIYIARRPYTAIRFYQGNIGPSKLDRDDRRSLGITFCELAIGRFAIELYKANRHFVDRIVAVGQRGVW